MTAAPRRWVRVGGDLDDPGGWALPLATLGGTRWSIHVLFVAWAVLEIVRAALAPRAADLAPRGPGRTALAVGMLLLAVLVHVAGHAVVARWRGGALPVARLWPLGGLADALHGLAAPRDRLLAALAGPAASLVALLLGGAVLGVTTGTVVGVAVPSPFTLPPLGALAVDGRQPAWLVALYELQRAGVVVLLANLLPMRPLDGASALEAALEGRRGPLAAARLVSSLGLATAAVLVALGAGLGLWGLVLLGAAGGAVSWLAARRTADVLPSEGGWERPLAGDPAVPADADDTEAQLDAVLRRIRAVGVGGLTDAERRVLSRETARRGGDGDGTGGGGEPTPPGL